MSVRIKVLTIDRNILCQLPYNSFIDKNTYDKAEFLGTIDVNDYNRKCRASMRLGTSQMIVVQIPNDVDNVFLVPMAGGFRNLPKTKDLKPIFVE